MGLFKDFTMDKLQPREFRYERKFLVDDLHTYQVRNLVKRHPGMFYEPFPPRYVNNLYLDTEDMQHYHENVNGVGERHKVRIRWYGDLWGDISYPVLEFKIKSGLVGTKYSYPFIAFRMDNRFSHNYFQKLIQEADLPVLVKQYLRELNAILCNRFYRWYYTTRGKQFRVTVDTEMAYYRVKKMGNRFLEKFVDWEHVVLELKYAKPLEFQAGKIAGFFPFSVTRNSKYVTGIDRVLG